MKNFNPFRYFILILILSGLFLNSCNKNNDPVQPENQYFLSSQLKSTITKQEAIANFTSLSPVAAAIGAFIVTDIKVQTLIYRTTFQNQNIQASGLVCWPKTAGNYPILSFQNGTNTLFSNAPSVAFNDDLFKIIESMASMGFIVVIPDYIGFGASSKFPHPYMDAKSTTQSILDMLRATKEYGAQDSIVAKPTNDLFIFGYSLGGWATMELQKDIEKNYPTEFNLVASSCGAGPYSIEYLNNLIISQPEYPSPNFLAYVLNSYKAVGNISNPLSDFFNEPYASLIPGLFDGLHSGGSINSQLTTNLTNLLTPDYRTGFATNSKFSLVKSAFLANSIAAWKTTTPTHLFHGTSDEVIPYSMSQKMLADFQTAGVTDKVELIRIPDADHTSGIYETGLQTILWFWGMKK
jgi:pimeloyl-ACP methyl ester carboxylesterase